MSTPTVSNSSRQKISRCVADPSSPIQLCDLSDVYRALHPKAAQSTFFTSEHGTVTRTDCILGHETLLNKFKLEQTLHKNHRPSICKITLYPWSTIKRGMPITIFKISASKLKKNLRKQEFSTPQSESTSCIWCQFPGFTGTSFLFIGWAPWTLEGCAVWGQLLQGRAELGEYGADDWT